MCWIGRAKLGGPGEVQFFRRGREGEKLEIGRLKVTSGYRSFLRQGRSLPDRIGTGCRWWPERHFNSGEGSAIRRKNYLKSISWVETGARVSGRLPCDDGQNGCAGCRQVLR